MFDVVLGQLAVVAAFVQRVIELLKPLYIGSANQKKIDIALSVACSAFLCVAWDIDVFAVASLAFPLEWMGEVITGLLAAAGANVLNDVLKLLAMWKERATLRG